jgi:hypothetical protein
VVSFGVVEGPGDDGREAFSGLDETGLVIMSQVRSGIFDTSDKYTILVGFWGSSPAGSPGRVGASMMNP